MKGEQLYWQNFVEFARLCTNLNDFTSFCIKIFQINVIKQSKKLPGPT